MHWVDRGSEPDGLASIRSTYTGQWIEYYEKGNGRRPTDTRWRDFHDDLAQVFFDLCGYCEETCMGEVDHFRPKSKYPALVYKWSNWVFACHDCNGAKLDKWPSVGYFDPCSTSWQSQTFNYFTFDLLTGEILPSEDLSPGQRRKASRMIGDLKLNAFHHLKKRLRQLSFVELIIHEIRDDGIRQHNFVKGVCSRDQQMSSMSRTLASQLGISFE